MQYPRRQHAVRPLHGPLEHGQPVRCPARVNERYREAGEHIDLALGRAGLAGPVQRPPQFAH